MSLSVNVFTRDETGKIIIHDAHDQSQELAGFEVFRKTFYGGPMALSLGLSLLPVLAERDLYVEGDDLGRLQEEAKLVLRNVVSFARAAAADSEVLRLRAQNILDATERAKKAGGGVVIW
jgi:hypothetical protein